jgi:hypothetical protein
LLYRNKSNPNKMLIIKYIFKNRNKKYNILI